MDIDKTRLEEALRLLDGRLSLKPAGPIGLVVCGGASLLAMGLVARTTRDVDIVALIGPERELIDPEPLPPTLIEAAAEVAEVLGLPDEWLNNRASRGDGGLFRMGLPEGLASRLHCRRYGSVLSVWFIGRLDQIHLKLFAAVDRGGYHISDLIALSPTDNEIEQAARWTLTHDVSEGFLHGLTQTLKDLRYDAVADRL